MEDLKFVKDGYHNMRSPWGYHQDVGQTRCEKMKKLKQGRSHDSHTQSSSIVCTQK